MENIKKALATEMKEDMVKKVNGSIEKEREHKKRWNKRIEAVYKENGKEEL